MTELWGALTRTETTGTLQFTRTYATAIDDLWQAVTDPARLARWFAPTTLLPERRYLVVFDPDDDQQRNEGEVLACEAPHRLQVTWSSPGDSRVSTITVQLSTVAGGTQLSLLHEGLAHDTDIGHAGGWEVYLRQLEQFSSGQQVDDQWHRWPEFRDAHQEALQVG